MEKLFLASHENLMNYGDDVLTYFMLEKFPKLPKKLQYARNPYINTVSVEVYRDDAGQYFWSEMPLRDKTVKVMESMWQCWMLIAAVCYIGSLFIMRTEVIFI